MTSRQSFSSDPLSQPSALLQAIRRAIEANVDWIQVREKDLSTRAQLELVRTAVTEARALASSSRIPARILVNDRLDIAAAASADGVHLGEASLPVRSVADWRRGRRAGDFLIGASCHSLEAACAAEEEGADYVFFGPVFSTPAKEKFGPPQGPDRLREVCGALRIPVLAIGGITLENAPSCVLAGAAGIAAIRMFQDSRDLPGVVAQLRTNLSL